MHTSTIHKGHSETQQADDRDCFLLYVRIKMIGELINVVAAGVLQGCGLLGLSQASPRLLTGDEMVKLLRSA